MTPTTPTDTHSTCQDSAVDSGDTSIDRLIKALTDPDYLFTRDQVAWLMGTAQRWGYEARVDEENASYPPPPVRVLGQWYDQARAREEADAAARLPRPNDFKGLDNMEAAA